MTRKGKYQVVRLPEYYDMETYRIGGMEVKLHVFLFSASDSWWLPSLFGRFTPGERTHWIGGRLSS